MARPSRFLRLPGHLWAAGAIIVAGLLAAGWSYRELQHTARGQAEANFLRKAVVLHARIADSLRRYDDALYSLRSAFALQGGVTQAEFLRLARDLAARNPGVQAFEWVPVVTAAERAAVESALSREAGGRPITLNERGADGRLRPAGPQPDYLPIRYVYPLAGNAEVLGYDLQTGPTRSVLARAGATRQMALTPQLLLVQEKQGQRGVVMIWPVYRTHPDNAADAGTLAGFVQAVFRVPDLLEAVRDQTLNPNSVLDLLFVDETEPDPAWRVLYYRPVNDAQPRMPAPSEAEFTRDLSQASPLPFGGRDWKVIYRPHAGWVGEQLTPLPWIRLVGIVTIAGLLAGLVIMLGRRAEVIAREVAERTAELTENRRQLGSLLQSLPGMAYRCQYDDQLRVMFVSVGVEALTGYPAEDFMAGRVHFRDLIQPEDVDRVRAATRAGLQARCDIEVEYRLQTRHGEEKWVLSRARGVYADNGQPLFLEGLAIDITARKQAEAATLALERRMLETQKLESLGLLAGGIAHDFNNILTGILGNASLARLKLSEDSVITPNLERIEQASARAAELCQQMLSYSGQSSFRVEPVDVSRLVQETLPLLHVSLASRARLHLNLSALPAVAQADSTQIRQIVMNLVINAADAMGERAGDIHVATGLRPFGPDFIREARDGTDLPPGPYVFIEVRDNGGGMTPQTLARIFDPFFTTKFAGRGLGLAAVRGIVRGHHGAIHVTSKPGRGTTFTLLLPPSAQPLAAPDPVAAEPRRYAGCVLVVDDEEPVRETAGELLRTFGFTTVLAKDGAEGIAQFALNPAGFTFVLLDLTMPSLGGEEVLSTLRAIVPEVRVLLISGYSESARIAKLAGIGALCFLQKPFTREELARRLAELLD